MNNEIKFLTPFKRMCMTIGTLPSSFYASMNYYESMVWLYEYLKNEVIPVVNNNSEVAQELQTAFTELETYIRTYFDNLDIQEEVNTKLDEMAEDGTLADIVAEYVRMQGQLIYDNVASMKLAENIQNGSFLKTYGYYSYNDGGGALYKARTITNEDVIDDVTIIALHDVTLVAELIILDEMNIECFGAKGDGSTNDTLSFKIAINNCETLHLQNKTYSVGHIDLLTNKNLKLYGNESVLKNNITNWTNLPEAIEGSIITNGYISEQINLIEINGITFDGNYQATTVDINTTDQSFSLLMFQNVNTLKIENCTFTNSYQGALELQGIKHCTVINNNIYSCGKGALSTLILQRNAINIRGFYYDRNLNNRIYIDETNAYIANNTIYDIVDECFMIAGLKNCTIENNNIYNIGQYVCEIFENNTYAEIKTIKFINNNVNNTGSTVFTFNNQNTINGTLSFYCLNNNITNIGGFSTYRINGKHNISNVTDYSILIIHLTEENTVKMFIENNIISMVETSPNPLFYLTCECWIKNNDINVTTLTSYIFRKSNKPLHLIGNKIYATDNLTTRYSLFAITKDSEIIDNYFKVTFYGRLFLLYESDVKVQNNTIINNPDTTSSYITIFDYRANAGEYLLVSNNIIRDNRMLFDSTLTEAYGTCLVTGNILGVTEIGYNSNKIAHFAKTANYPTTFND